MKQSNSAVTEIYPFAEQKDSALFHKITHELRCSVCQNQDLADSMAPLAIDLRTEIYRQIKMGASEQTIKAFVTERYGEYVLYQPPLQWYTVLLWLAPLMMVCLVVWRLLKLTRNKMEIKK
jgi:cytochrome c-type biogenesis protein CcmH